MKKIQLTIARLILLGAGGVILWLGSHITCSQFGRCPSFTKEGQFINECKELVERRLKSPGSAKFGGITPGEYWIEGYVDSQNGFGAIIRSHFACSNDGSQTTLEMIK